jgi:GDP-4-dehydro-6-deoxy-D-mannose reductase
LERASERELIALLEAASPNVVFHLAALSVPADCGDVEMTPRCRLVNVEATRRLIEAVAALANPPRLVYVSSSHVYGAVAPESPFVAESSPLAPATAYGRSKLLAEEAVLEATAAGRIEAVVARAVHHAGPRQDERLMLSEWARQLATGAPVVRVKRLDAWIDLSDVRDVAAAYRLLATHGESGQVVNVGSGVAWRTGDLFRELCDIGGASPQVEETSPGVHHEPIADIRQLEQAGWRPQNPLSQTLSDTLRYWQRRLGQ